MLAAQTFVTMVSAFVPLPGSSGGAEGSFYLFFGSFFGATIIPAILLWRLVTYYANILFGCLTNVVGRALGIEGKKRKIHNLFPGEGLQELVRVIILKRGSNWTMVKGVFE